jgi:hypothetical protein
MDGGTRTKPKRGGSKLKRSETVTIRLDPKLRYLTELASRKQRRTVSSFIEWAIEKALTSIILREYEEYGHHMEESLGESAETLWDPDEPDRLAKLGLHYPELLTYDEQVLWKLIRECGALWRGTYDQQGFWKWDVEPSSLVFQKLREHWEDFERVAAGEVDRNTLPQAPRKVPKKAPESSEGDDIPF